MRRVIRLAAAGSDQLPCRSTPVLSFRSKDTVPPLYWLGSLALIALGDYLTGPFIHSAILFYLLPVALSAWGSRSRWPGLAVALIWPLLRLGIVAQWGWPWPLTLTIEDTIVNGIVSVGFATLVWQLRSQGERFARSRGCFRCARSATESARTRNGSGWTPISSTTLTPRSAIPSAPSVVGPTTGTSSMSLSTRPAPPSLLPTRVPHGTDQTRRHESAPGPVTWLPLRNELPEARRAAIAWEAVGGGPCSAGSGGAARGGPV